MNNAETTAMLTDGECLQYGKLMEQKYSAVLGQRFLEVTATAESREVQVKVILRNTSCSFYYPVQGRIKILDDGLSQREAALFMLDYIDLYFEEFLNDDAGVYLPIEWADYSCEGVEFQLKGQVLNLELERAADELLAGRAAGGKQDLI